MTNSEAYRIGFESGAGVLDEDYIIPRRCIEEYHRGVREGREFVARLQSQLSDEPTNPRGHAPSFVPTYMY